MLKSIFVIIHTHTTGVNGDEEGPVTVGVLVCMNKNSPEAGGFHACMCVCVCVCVCVCDTVCLSACLSAVCLSVCLQRVHIYGHM